MFFNDFGLLFPGNSSYSFHPIGLKHGGELDYKVMQHVILFQAYRGRGVVGWFEGVV